MWNSNGSGILLFIFKLIWKSTVFIFSGIVSLFRGIFFRSSIKKIKLEDTIEINLKDGIIKSKVLEVEEK